MFKEESTAGQLHQSNINTLKIAHWHNGRIRKKRKCDQNAGVNNMRKKRAKSTESSANYLIRHSKEKDMTASSSPLTSTPTIFPVLRQTDIEMGGIFISKRQNPLRELVSLYI